MKQNCKPSSPTTIYAAPCPPCREMPHRALRLTPMYNKRYNIGGILTNKLDFQCLFWSEP